MSCNRDRLKYLAGLLLLGAIYFVAGRIGLTFAGGQDNVTLIWPPTGIAVAAVWLFGYRVWPGLAIGAFLVNVSTEAP